MASSSCASPTRLPGGWTVGALADVDAGAGVGVYGCLGGTGWVTALYDGRTVDVKFVVGGGERGVPLARLHHAFVQANTPAQRAVAAPQNAAAAASSGGATAKAAASQPGSKADVTLSAALKWKSKKKGGERHPLALLLDVHGLTADMPVKEREEGWRRVALHRARHGTAVEMGKHLSAEEKALLTLESVICGTLHDERGVLGRLDVAWGVDASTRIKVPQEFLEREPKRRAQGAQ